MKPVFAKLILAGAALSLLFNLISLTAALLHIETSDAPRTLAGISGALFALHPTWPIIFAHLLTTGLLFYFGWRFLKRAQHEEGIHGSR